MREVPDYLGTDDRFQRLPPESWISQLAPLDGSEFVLRHRSGDDTRPFLAGMRPHS